jgi:hypothetical protein
VKHGAENALTTALVQSIPRLVDSRSQDKDQISPQAIPVTITKILAEGKLQVKAEIQGNFTIPQMVIAVNYGEWLRHAHAVGDKGYVLLGDYYTGGQTNLGGGTASYRGQGRANLTTAVFHPLSNTKFATNANRNLNATLVSGPQGAVINDKTGNTTITANGTVITLTIGSTLEISMSGNNIFIQVPTGGKLFLGGNGTTGTYSPVQTQSGTPSINVEARIS